MFFCCDIVGACKYHMKPFERKISPGKLNNIRMHAGGVEGRIIVAALAAGGVFTEEVRNLSMETLKKVHEQLIEIYYENPPFDSPELTETENDIVYDLIQDVQRHISTTCN